MDATTAAMVLVLLNPARMYYQPNQPVPVKLDTAALARELARTPGAAGGEVRLLLLSPAGQVRASAAIDAKTADLDLGALFSGKAAAPKADQPVQGGEPGAGLWDGRVHYVQLWAGGKALGTPLVVVPLSPPNLTMPRPPDALRIQVDKHIVMHTDQGDLTIALDHEAAPNTTLHFARLVEGGFYTNVIFHRIIPGFVVQSGDPTGTGTGGPGCFVDLESSPKLHRPGTLSMARQGHDVNTNGSQFFICLTRERCAPLDRQYTAFGDVIDGWTVVEKIAGTKLADEKTGRPVEPPVIKSAQAVPAPPRKVEAAATRP